MESLPHPDEIRESVRRTFSEFGRKVVDGATIRETVLIRGGYYYGRAYRVDRLLATFVVETGTLSFYSDENLLVRSMQLAVEAVAPDRKAA